MGYKSNRINKVDGNIMINNYELEKKREFTTGFIVLLLLYAGIITIIISSSLMIEIIDRIAIMTILVICIYKGRKEEYMFNPYYLFAITPLVLFFYFESISPYYLVKLTQSTWNIAIWNMTMFVTGLSIISNKGNINLYAKTGINNADELVFHSRILLFLGLTPTIYGIMIGFPTLLNGNFYAMKEFTTAMPLTSIFMLFLYPAIVCSIKSEKRMTIFITILACVLSEFLHFNKTGIAYILVTLIISISKYSKNTRINNYKLILFILAGAGIMLWSFSYYDSLRSSFDTASYLLDSNRVSSTLKKDFVLPYLYLSTPWTNLQYVMNTQANHTFGLWTIKPFISYLQLDQLFAKEYALFSSSSFNTYTYITVLFKDFGIIGSGFISLLLGLMIKRIYIIFRASDSPLLTSVYALNSLAVIMMFFSNHFFSQSYPFTIIIIMNLYYLFFLKGRRYQCKIG